MIEYINNGFTVFDLADHYGPSEDLYGELNSQVYKDDDNELGLDSDRKKEITAFTKWFPRPGNMSLENVSSSIENTIQRMKVTQIDLLQFHWWDYDDERYILALQSLKSLQNQGKIRHIGLTNFDTATMKRIVMDGNSPSIVSNQVSYSVIDRRVEKTMIKYCKDADISILAYGVCLGGLISEKFLGVPQPSQVALNTWSLSKYSDYVNRWGGWNLFQELLEQLKLVGDKYSVSLTAVAIRYILDKEMVAAVILGCRLGIHQHIDETKSVFSFKLDQDDIKKIDKIASKGDTMLGWNDCGDEYR
ncbi:hypothetical protein DLAC_05512 [Tieghemostelium lacteum]|uniref:NADP-dependent oxidoreductase domain-containing protein n=1 Tax=Tieghemostelium lacteum TaxID=361077 RepID=A0A151ZG21_TIELA|nr:hypothetical protein DLAC_05512 [Tieghemostelium lacteum]|eukprot:KYQ92918.1 hypothetical protein DLAC_05512 [Tieghemostelium lacteum]